MDHVRYVRTSRNRLRVLILFSSFSKDVIPPPEITLVGMKQAEITEITEITVAGFDNKHTVFTDAAESLGQFEKIGIDPVFGRPLARRFRLCDKAMN
jgi:hypothetical protein